MAFKFLNNVQQYATGNGVGGITLGSVTSPTFRDMAAAGMFNGDTTRVRIQHATELNEWEVVLVEFNDGTLERTFDETSFSSTGELIDFSDGFKIISSVVIAGDVARRTADIHVVRDYTADNTGETDTSAQIQNALDRAEVYSTITGSANVIFEAGDYLMMSSTNVKGNNVKLFMYGANIHGEASVAAEFFKAAGTLQDGGEINLSTEAFRKDGTLHVIGHGMGVGDHFLHKSNVYSGAFLLPGDSHTITNITNWKPPTVTYTGDDPFPSQRRLFSGVNGMTEINGRRLVVGDVDTVAKTYTVYRESGLDPENSLEWGVYTSGGEAQQYDYTIDVPDEYSDMILGESTASTKPPYWAEPNQVKSVPDADHIELVTPVLFPWYPIEPHGHSPRNCSTVQKMNFVKGFAIYGGTFYPGTGMVSCVTAELCLEPVMKDMTFEMGTAICRAITFRRVLRGTRDNWNVVASPAAEDSIGRNAMYNNSVWYCKDINFKATNGFQLIDYTWTSEGECPIENSAFMAHLVNCVNAITTHPCCYKGDFSHIHFTGCDQGLYLRSPYYKVHHCVGEHAEGSYSSRNRYGITLGPWARFCEVDDNDLTGVSIGIRDLIDGILGNGPAYKRNKIRRNKLRHMNNGIALLPATFGGQSNENCGILLEGNMFDYITEQPIYNGAYRNGVMIWSNEFGPQIRDEDPESTIDVITCIDLRPNSMDCWLKDNKFLNIGPNARPYRVVTATDTDTFPLTDYPVTWVRIETSYFSGVTGVPEFVSGIQNVQTGSYTIKRKDAFNNSQLTYYSNSDGVFTFPDQAAEPTWAEGDKITIRQGLVGKFTVNASGATVFENAQDPLNQTSVQSGGQYSSLTFTRRYTDTWMVEGKMTV